MAVDGPSVVLPSVVPDALSVVVEPVVLARSDDDDPSIWVALVNPELEPPLGSVVLAMLVALTMPVALTVPVALAMPVVFPSPPCVELASAPGAPGPSGHPVISTTAAHHGTRLSERGDRTMPLPRPTSTTVARRDRDVSIMACTGDTVRFGVNSRCIARGHVGP